MTENMINSRLFDFSWWVINACSNDSYGRRMERSGYRGICSTDESSLETNHIVKWCREKGRDLVISGRKTNHETSERFNDIMKSSYSQRCLWMRPELYTEFEEMIDAIPERTIELVTNNVDFSNPTIVSEMRRLNRDKINYKRCHGYDYKTDQHVYILSIQDFVGLNQFRVLLALSTDITNG